MAMEFRVDLQGVKTRKGLHKVLRRELPMPEWYGNNLDALYDVLTDPSFAEGEQEVSIFFSGTEDVREALSGYYRAFVELCRAAQENREGLNITFL